MPRITVVVNDEQKARWDDFAEESRSLDSTANLVREGVEAYIKSDKDSDSADYEGEVLNDTLVAIEDVDSVLRTVETELKALRTENVQRDEMEGIVAEMVYHQTKDVAEDLLMEYDFGKEDRMEYERR